MRRRGSILMICLWVLAILVVFVIGLGNRAMINLKLARSQKERLASELLAQSGIEKAILFLSSAASAVSKDSDCLTDPWSIGIDPDTKNYIFKEIELSQGSGNKFTIGFLDQGNNYHCMSDEESRVNLNFVSPAVLSGIFAKGGVESGVHELVNYALYWRNDPALDVTLNYPQLKKDKFSNCAELVSLLEYFYKGKIADYQKKAWDVYKQLENYITVYSPSSAVNVNTVSPEALAIMANALATNAEEISAAASLSEKIITLRNAQPVNGEGDIRTLAQLSTAEGNFLNKLAGSLTFKSSVFRIDSSSNSGRTLMKISAIYDRKNKKIVFWRQI
ncbi:MAG: type II secretion system protein GspK [Candidatus Omnitrophica bacterium]|nr:type II secretion system protein GspK [Candidatus Omnitrophota bacterium]